MIDFKQICLFLSLAACTRPMPVVLPAASPIPSSTLVVLPTASPTPGPTPTATLQELKWSTYRFEPDVSVDYPSDWRVVARDTDWVRWSGGEDQIRVQVYRRPLDGGSVSDPHTVGTNEGGYTILWEKPIAIEHARGLEYLWGTGSPDPFTGYFRAVYSSDAYDLEVSLGTVSDRNRLDSELFRVFESMVARVRIGP